jgi:predicted AAA+ superfamily ATPase
LISQGIKISKKTLYAFQKIVEDVNFGFFLKKFEWSKKKVELSMPKFYLIDNALYAYFQREDLGKLLENVVFLELIKNGFTPNEDFFYWRNAQGDEVDFVTKGGTRIKNLIQVTYSFGKDEVDKREIEALIKASVKLKCKDLLIITWDYEDELRLENRKVRFIPLWKWLTTPL